MGLKKNIDRDAFARASATPDWSTEGKVLTAGRGISIPMVSENDGRISTELLDMIAMAEIFSLREEVAPQQPLASGGAESCGGDQAVIIGKG